MQQHRARRHPLRQRLSRDVVPVPVANPDSDLKLFAVSFTAFFLCFYTFFL